MGTLEGYVEGMINLSGGGGGGTSDYEDLENKPSINNVTLSGNKTTSDLNLSYNDLLNKPYINNMPSSTGADIGDVLTHTSDGDEWAAPEKELPAISVTDEGKALTISNGAAVWGDVEAKTDYSTEETEIGTWIDGSPYYQKIITYTATKGGNTADDITDYLPANALVLDFIPICYYTYSGVFYGYDGYYLNYKREGNTHSVVKHIGNNTLTYTMYITVKYIKVS